METAAKKPEQTEGAEDTEERAPGEEAAPADQEEKVLDTIQIFTKNWISKYLPTCACIVC